MRNFKQNFGYQKQGGFLGSILKKVAKPLVSGAFSLAGGYLANQGRQDAAQTVGDFNQATAPIVTGKQNFV